MPSLLEQLATALSARTSTRCPRCHAHAMITDYEGDGGLTWWSCWNGHNFTIGTNILRKHKEHPSSIAVERIR